jgi:hypothetical protein
MLNSKQEAKKMKKEVEEEKALVKVVQKTDVVSDGTSEQLRLNLFEKQVEAGRELGGKVMDYMTTVDNNRVRMAEVLQKAKDSENAYNFAKDQLRVFEETLKENFAERKIEIEKEFNLIDKALEAGNWDAVVKIFDSGSKMVATSPLAGIAERKDKIIKQRRNITSFDDV